MRVLRVILGIVLLAVFAAYCYFNFLSAPKTADFGADALITTEKDAVRFPRLETTPVPCYYLRVDIEILKGAENFAAAVGRICHI